MDGDLIENGQWDLDDDGVADIKVTPSLGRDFLRNDYQQWKSIKIDALGDDVSVTFTHELYGHDAECPVHNRGAVNVNISDSGDTTRTTTPNSR